MSTYQLVTPSTNNQRVSRIRLAAQYFVHLMRGAKHLDSLLHIFVILEVVLLASGLIIKVLDNGPFHYATYLAFPTLKVVVFVVCEFALERIEFSLGLGFVALEACHLAQGRQQFEALTVVAEVVLFM